MTGQGLLRFHPPRSALWAGALALLGVGVFSVRRSFVSTNDFRTSIWDAGRAIVRGSDPYNVGEFHRMFPGQGWMPVYGPPHLWLAVAFALLPLGVATALWFVFNLGGMIVIAIVAVRTFGRTATIPVVLAVTGLLILSRPGRASFGQMSVYYVLVTYVAWSQTRRRPMLAAVALMLALGKPPFGLPLLGLLLIDRAWPVIRRALVLLVAVSAPMVLWLSLNEGSLRAFWNAVVSNLRYSDHTPVDRVGAVRRIDAISLIGRYVHGISGGWELLAFVVAMALAGLLLRRRSAEGGWSLTPTVLLTLGLVSLLSIVHQDYDLLLLAWPFAGLLSLFWAPNRRVFRSVLVVALPALVTSFIPATTTAKLLGLGPDVGLISSVTTACLLLAFVGSLAALVVERDPPIGEPTPAADVGRRRSS